MSRRKEKQPDANRPTPESGGRDRADGLAEHSSFNFKLLAQGIAANLAYDERQAEQKPFSKEEVISSLTRKIWQFTNDLQESVITPWGQIAVKQLSPDSVLMRHYRNLGEVLEAKTAYERRELSITPLSQALQVIDKKYLPLAESGSPILRELPEIAPDIGWYFDPEGGFDESAADKTVHFERLLITFSSHLKKQNALMAEALQEKGFLTPNINCAGSLFVPISCLGFWIPVPKEGHSSKEARAYLAMVVENARSFYKFFTLTGETILPDPRLYSHEPWLAIKTELRTIPDQALAVLPDIGKSYIESMQRVVQKAIDMEIPLPKNEQSQSLHLANATDALNLATIAIVISGQILENLKILKTLAK